MLKFRNIDDDTDYMAKRNEAAAKGDLAAAERYERDRNYKIDKLGLSTPKTFDYIDIGNEMKVGMENGAPGAYIKEMDDYRVNKANTTPGLKDFSNDEIHQAAMRYHYNDLMGVGGNYQNKPTYNDKYGAAVDKLFDRIMSGEDFSYDVESDPSFQSYKDMYTREGKRAMQDTLAQLSQNAGGNNSYAVSAAAQANNYYMQQLMDKVPELYDAAYNRYMNEENLKRQDLELARMLQSDDYNRYLGDMGVFQTNVGLANDMIDSQLNREYQDRNWKYNVEQDEKNWDWMLNERDYTRSEAEKKDAQETVWTMVERGEMPDIRLIESAGMGGYAKQLQEIAGKNAQMWDLQMSGAATDNYYNQLRNKSLEQELGILGIPVTGGSDYTRTTPYTIPEPEPVEPIYDEKESKSAESYIDQESVSKLGMGPLTMNKIDELVDKGILKVGTKNGKIAVEFADSLVGKYF